MEAKKKKKKNKKLINILKWDIDIYGMSTVTGPSILFNSNIYN